jgi:hypothetical protein
MGLRKVYVLEPREFLDATPLIKADMIPSHKNLKKEMDVEDG